MRLMIGAAAFAAGVAAVVLADEGHDHGEPKEPPAAEAGKDATEGDHMRGAGESPEHEAAESPAQEMMERMRRMHAEHDHGHDFVAMEEMSPERMRRVMNAMFDLGLAVPPMDGARGRELFVEKGCIVCHEVSGVGGRIGPSLNAEDMPEPMNTFEFAARMWRGAPAMIEMQENLFGDAIELTGGELADIIAFAHDEAEQRKLATDHIPVRYRELMGE